MWFSKKNDEVDVYKTLREERNNQIRILDGKFKKGQTFKYLGIDCLVTHTTENYADFVFCGIGSIPTISTRAELKADYVDKNGVIRVLSLSYEEAMRIET